MSLNLQNDGIAAVKELRSHPAFAALRAVLAREANSKANAAIDAPHELQASACGYARALRDLYVALESAVQGVPQNKVTKPGAVEKA